MSVVQTEKSKKTTTHLSSDSDNLRRLNSIIYEDGVRSIFNRSEFVSEKKFQGYPNKPKRKGEFYTFDLLDVQAWLKRNPKEKPTYWMTSEKLENQQFKRWNNLECGDIKIDVGRISSNSNEFFVNFLNLDADAENPFTYCAEVITVSFYFIYREWLEILKF